MKPVRPDSDLEHLLRHADWVRTLALALVHDRDRAEDVVGETWIAALRTPPSDLSNVRGWFATVVRNVVRGMARADARREFRERVVARDEALAPEHELAERARKQHELVEHVLALDEPYRLVLLLRYFEDLPSRAIAARLRIPVATVRTRHARGLQRLRERLARERDADEWRRELSAVALASSSVHPAAIGWTGGVWMGMQAKAWTAAAIVLLALGGIWWSTTRPSAESATTVGAVLVSHEGLRETTVVDEVGATTSQRLVVPVETPDPDPAPSSADSKPVTVPASVLDTHGRPVPHARLMRLVAFGRPIGAPLTPEAYQRFLREQPSPESEPAAHAREVLALLDDPATYLAVDAEGRFEAPVERTLRPAVFAWSPGWVTIACGWRTTPGGEEFVVVIERTARVTGSVMDERGDPIPSASVRPRVSLQTVRTFPDTLQRTGEYTNFGSAEVDDAGRFELVGVPVVEGLGLEVWAQGFSPRVVAPINAELVEPLSIVLNRSARTTTVVEIDGRVLDVNGEGVAGAAVFFGSVRTSTNGTGAFRMRVDRDIDRTLATEEQGKPNRLRHDLVATRPGLQPAVIEDFGTKLDDPNACSGIVLRFDSPSLSISGRVVDFEGKPRPDVEVVLLDPTVLGNTSGLAEDQASRAPVQRILGRRFVTDAEGKFEVDGLRSREYRLRAIDLGRCVAVESGPTRAGTRDLVLREPDPPCHQDVHGQVVSTAGRPLRGVRVAVEFRVVRSNGLIFSREGPATVTDHEGNFALASMPKEHASLVVSGTNVAEGAMDVDGYVPGGPWRITVSVNARFRLETPATEPVTAISVLDVDGHTMNVTVNRADRGRFGYERVPAELAVDSVCTTDDRATTLVLYGEAGEIRRVPIRLSADELTVIRP